jgi:hypothetical protein
MVAGAKPTAQPRIERLAHRHLIGVPFSGFLFLLTHSFHRHVVNARCFPGPFQNRDSQQNYHHHADHSPYTHFSTRPSVRLIHHKYL